MVTMKLIEKKIKILLFSPINTAIILVSLFLLTCPAPLCATEGFFQKGFDEYGKENYEEALEFFNQARMEEPDSSEIAYYLGLTYRQTGNFQEAAQRFMEAIQKNPSAKEAYIELIETFYDLNDLKSAKDWLNRAEKQGVGSGRLAFLEGMILLKEDHNQEAVKAFQKAKALDPALSSSADLQIAVAYVKDRKFSQSRERLQAIVQGDPYSDISILAREYEADIQRNLEKHKRWGASVGVAYQYDDNVVLKPSGVIPGVVITGDKDSSIITSLRAYYNPLLEGNWFFSNQYSIYTNTYFSTTSNNLLNQAMSLNPGYNFGRSAVTLPVTYSHVWLSGTQYLGVLSARPSWSISLLPDHIGQVSMGHARRWMYQPALITDEDRDAHIFSGSLGHRYGFWEKGSLNLLYEFTWDLTDGKNWENNGHRFNLSLLIPIVDKISLSLSGELFYQYYSQIHSIFGVNRSDKTYSGTIGLIWELWKDVTLNLQYYRAKADSNIFIYDYQRNVVTLGIQFGF